jgi:hypothetical protein
LRAERKRERGKGIGPAGKEGREKREKRRKEGFLF